MFTDFEARKSTRNLSTAPKTASTLNNIELVNLLSLCQQGDQKAFGCLYQLTAAKLNGIAYRITRNVDSANEVLQEAFIQIWENRAQYCVTKSEVFTWLASIVRYRAYDRLRYDTRRHKQDAVEFDDNTFTNDQRADVINQQMQNFYFVHYSEQALYSCLEKLEQKQSQSILMAYLYGYTREDISEHFSTPMNTIKSWIRRGLKRLQLCLSD